MLMPFDSELHQLAQEDSVGRKATQMAREIPEVSDEKIRIDISCHSNSSCEERFFQFIFRQ